MYREESNGKGCARMFVYAIIVIVSLVAMVGMAAQLGI